MNWEIRRSARWGFRWSARAAGRCFHHDTNLFHVKEMIVQRFVVPYSEAAVEDLRQRLARLMRVVWTTLGSLPCPGEGT